MRKEHRSSYLHVSYDQGIHIWRLKHGCWPLPCPLNINTTFISAHGTQTCCQTKDLSFRAIGDQVVAFDAGSVAQVAPAMWLPKVTHTHPPS